MSTKEDVIRILMNSDGYVSGEVLARKLGKSRAAVWKAIRALRSEGVTIDAVTNKGYLLTDSNDVLNENVIAARLDYDTKVMFYPVIDSTNTQAKRLINEDEDGNLLVVAAAQTGGRGRQGKSFYSPEKSGVYFSFVTHPMESLQNVVGATTAASVAVCRAIESLTDIRPAIKWINDVYVGGKKVCGILTEALTDFETGTVTSVIIGIGVNISTSDFGPDVDGAGCLACPVRRADLIAAIANELNCINLSDRSRMMDYYRSHSMIIGEEINFIRSGVVTPATAVSIHSDGGLEVRLTDGSTTVLRSGEITVRKR